MISRDMGKKKRTDVTFRHHIKAKKSKAKIILYILHNLQVFLLPLELNK